MPSRDPERQLGNLMDTLREENRQRDARRVDFVQNRGIEETTEEEEDEEMSPRRSISSPPNRREYCFLHPPQLLITDTDAQLKNNCECDSRGDSSAVSSRRPSAIIAALRRPSQAIALSAAQAIMNQRRYLLGLFNENPNLNTNKDPNKKDNPKRICTRTLENDGFTIILSALYAKLLVVLGIAFPLTEVISSEVQPFYYQGFYLYLYLGSMLFMTYQYVGCIREKAVNDIIKNYNDNMQGEFLPRNSEPRPSRKYGSFYLRLGAIAFGIGSMVYSGLEFGRYFELKNTSDCHYTALQATTPAVRMILTLFQIQFIFLNHKKVDLNRHIIISRFGLMHMIAGNLCEWLNVLVEETKHEIIHLEKHFNSTNATGFGAKYCQDGRLMGSLVNNASPFLFPCTIEYSLICAVILFEMWKHLRSKEELQKENGNKKKKHHSDSFVSTNSGHHFTIDCSSSHKGLFAGIMVIVLTIISLVMFFVLAEKAGGTNEKTNYGDFQVNLVELFLYMISIMAVLVAMYQLRNLKYERRIGQDGIGLDNTLLAVAQTGMFIYSMFSIIGWYFTLNDSSPVGLVADIFAFIQTCLQTMFVLDAWWRRCRNIKQAKRKPGRELITFLIIANMAMWSINTLEKNRAEFRPTHLHFFGDWGWTIITHISMPLAIFYRFHSTICLFEVWKTAYKIKSNFKNPLFPVM